MKLFGENFQNLFAQAKNLQGELQRVQKEVEQKQVEGSAGAGMVSVTVNGAGEVVSVRIDPAVVKEDVTMLQDLVLAAANDGIAKSKALLKEEMQKFSNPFGSLFS